MNPSFVQPFAFTGREYDPETGLYDYRFRFYEPEIGRFISEDPIEFAGGINFFAYVGNKPVNFVDPLGLYIGQYPPAPPGYDPSTWQQGQWANGKWYVKSSDGRVYTVHPEDKGHWRHWDIQGPTYVTVQFFQVGSLFRREPLGVFLCAFWFGENFLNISHYVADARTMTLPLVGSGDHDWNILLTEVGMLQHDKTIAAMVTVCGWAIMISSIAWLIIRWLKNGTSVTAY